MKKSILQKGIVISFLLAAIIGSAKSQDNIKWAKQFGTDKEEYVLNHVGDKNGNLYISGKTLGVMNGQNYGKNDGFITKTDSLGNILWSRQFGSNEEEDVLWSAIDGKGNVYITGSTTGALSGVNFGKEDIFIVKYSPEGMLEWTKQFGTDSTDVSYGIYADRKGFIYVTGFTLGKLGKSSFGASDIFIMKLDANGNNLLTRQYGTLQNDFARAISGNNKSEIYVCGMTMGDIAAKNKGFMDAYVGYFTDKLEPVKFLQFGTDGFDMALQVISDNEKNIYVGGSTSGNLEGNQLGEGDCFLTKINQKGEIAWSRQFGTDKHDGIRGIDFNSKVSDNILVSGLLNLPPAQSFVRMYKKDGTLLWEKIFKDSSGKDVYLDDRGNISHIGLTMEDLYGKSFGSADFCVVKLALDRKFRNH